MSAKRQKYDKDYSSEDICFPHVKGFREEGSPNHKIDSPCMKYPEDICGPAMGKVFVGTGMVDEGYMDGV
jgi:hypothetical protein